MKTLEELTQLKDEMTTAYNTVVTSTETRYDQATIVYAQKCMEDAVKAYKLALLDTIECPVVKA